jgi:hypothetical protein
VTAPAPSGDGRVQSALRSRIPAHWRSVLGPFLLARVVVLLALLVAALVHPVPHRTTLLGWDAEWYQRIADFGYLGIPIEGRRFFPLLPLLTRVLGYPIGSTGIALLLVTNAAAIGYALLARALARDLLVAGPAAEHISGDSLAVGRSSAATNNKPGIGRRAADLMPWVVLMSPTAFVLVLGYAEALVGMAVCGALLCAHRGHWWLVLFAGLAAGALRPTGVLLVLPLVIEALRAAPPTWPRRAVAAAAALSPLLGLGCYLAYAAWFFSDPLQPFRVQTEAGLRGGVLKDPVTTVGQAVQQLFGGESVRAGALVHLPWIVVCIALLIAGRRLLPTSYLWYGAATCLLGVTAGNFQSFERYGTSAVPLLLITAVLLARVRRRRAWLVVAASLVLFGYALCAFIGSYVP